MSGTAAAFRSQIMQQIVSSARNQTRPPIAISAIQKRLHSSSISSSPSSSNASAMYDTASSPLTGSPPISYPPKSISSADDKSDQKTSDESSLQSHVSSIQSMIQSRRTIAHFLPPPVPNIQHAIHRAVQCAITAPNHKRTEPFTFRSIVSPSETTDRLAEIVYEVTLSNRIEQGMSEMEATTAAEKKREKCRNTPAFLVATVAGQMDQMEASEEGEEDMFRVMKMCPPESERQLEDYAATCAAIQNILLSLHSEGLGSKWATSGLLRTVAFRRLANIRNDELVVGLIMIGISKRHLKARRRARTLEGDLLQTI